MARRKALLFTDVGRFVDYVRLGSPRSSSTKGFALIEVTWPASGQRCLLLLGHRAKPWSVLQRTSEVFGEDPAEILQHIEVIVDDDAVIWLDEGEKRPCIVHSRRGAHTLIELVGLQTWREPPTSGPVIFRSTDSGSLEQLVLDSLALGNDRIQVAALSSGELLVKIESPSWYLLQRCLEDSSTALLVPMPGSNGQAWISWGWRHPLAALWNAALDPGAIILFAPNRSRQEHAQPDWRDLYDTAEIALDVPTDPIVLAPAAIERTFHITVQLAPRARPQDPELWLVEDADLVALEQLLTALDESDLDELLIAPVHSGGETPRYLLRERHTGSGRTFIDFSPQAFAPWLGVPDLFVPADKTLLPHLRRDRYRSLFGLRPGSVTVYISPSELIQVSSSAFVPLSRLVDYQISAQVERIESLMARNLFEFAPYTRAPARPELLTAGHAARPKHSPATAQPAPTKTVDRDTAALPEEDASQKPAPPAKKPESTPLTELARQERDIERAIIEEPSTERWAQLSQLKDQVGKLRAAYRCSIEAWWLSPAGSGDAHHARALSALLSALQLSGSPASQSRQALQQSDLLSSVAYVLLGSRLPPGHIDHWVLQAARLLTSHQGDLPKKVRWLAWGEVWKVNQDVRAQARVRTQILADLDAIGLTAIDMPDFLQSRLLEERSLADDEDAGEVTRALLNLEGIHNAIREMPTELRCGGLAVLARAYHRLGHLDRAISSINQAREDATSPFITAWIQLFAADTKISSDDDRLQSLLANLPSFEAGTIRAFSETLRSRRGEDDPLSFLSSENLSRLYPTTPSIKRNPLYPRLEHIAQLRQKNQQHQFFQEIRTWLIAAAEQAGSVNTRDIATLVHRGVREISRLQSGKTGPKLTRRFIEFSTQCLDSIGGRSDYFSLLFQLSLAQGAVDLDRTATGLEIFMRTMRHLQSADCITLDLVDVCAAGIQVLESADLTQRGAALSHMLKALVSQSHRLSDLTSSSNTLSMLQLLDQLCEASVSKDRVTQGRYRRYQDLDELLIRERILSEDHCL